nr:hypothetical protein [Haloarcula quadrata]
MADLLTHLLAPYILLTVASWRVDWLDQRWVVVGMGGAAIPDLVKVGIVLNERVVEAFLGVPFTRMCLPCGFNDRYSASS